MKDQISRCRLQLTGYVNTEIRQEQNLALLTLLMVEIEQLRSRVDGNDTLACLEATKVARKYIIQNKKPYFLEFMTYRLGDHSTSDNSTLYRKEDERTEWREKNNPIKRLTGFFKSVGYKGPNQEEER